MFSQPTRAGNLSCPYSLRNRNAAILPHPLSENKPEISGIRLLAEVCARHEPVAWQARAASRDRRLLSGLPGPPRPPGLRL